MLNSFKRTVGGLLVPLRVLDNKWFDDQVPQSQRNGVAFLAVMYFCQLFMFRFISVDSFFLISDPSEKYNSQLWQFSGTIIGAVCAAASLFILRKKGENSIKVVLNASNLLLSGLYLFYIYRFSPFTGIYHSLFKFLIGFGNSVFIGLAIVWTCESLYRHLRTTGTLYVGAFGFLGATFASMFEKTTSGIVINVDKYTPPLKDVTFNVESWDNLFLIVPIIMVILSIVLLCAKQLLKDAPMVSISIQHENEPRSESPEEANWKSMLQNSFLWKERKLVICSFLIGLPVQFWVFFAGHSYELFTYGKGTFFRYLGASMGTILFILYFKKGSVRRRDVALFWLTVGSFILCIILLLVRNEIKSEVLLSIIFFITGILSISWVLAILYVGEQFNLKWRPWLIILAPNIYRASEIILLARTQAMGKIKSELPENIQPLISNNRMPSLLADLIDNIHKGIYTSDQFIAVALWGVIFSFLALVAVLVLKKNSYEGDALGNSVENDGKIDEASVLVEIGGIKKQPESEFYNEANDILRRQFKKVFGLQFYTNSIYYKSVGLIKHTIFTENNKAIACNLIVEGYSTEGVHGISAKLVEEKKHESFVDYLLLKNKGGGLMYVSRRDNRTLKSDDFEDIKLTTVDLSEIEVKNMDHGRMKVENWQDFENIEVESYGGLENSYPPKLLQTFSLFRIDAEAYAPETYFLYLVKPVSNDSKCIMVIKTAIELDEDNLRRLRNLISAVQAKWNEISSDQEYERRKHLHFSALHAHFLKNLVRSTSDFFHVEKDKQIRDKVTERIGLLFSEVMDAQNPFITIKKENEFLRNYLQVYLYSKLQKLNEKHSRDWITMKFETELPFKWNLTIDAPDNMEIPRGLIQPLIENALSQCGNNSNNTLFNDFKDLQLKIEIEMRRDNKNVLVNVSNKPLGKIKVKEIGRSISGDALKPETNRPSSLYYINESLKVQNSKKLEKLINFQYEENKSFMISFEIENCRIPDKHEIINTKTNVGIVHRPSKRYEFKTLLIDDNKSDSEMIKKIIDDNNPLEISLQITETVDQFDDATEILRNNDYNLIITDWALSNDITDSAKWCTTLLEPFLKKLISSETGIIVISNSSESKEYIDREMRQLFGDNYLGFSSKFEHTGEDLDHYINKYVQLFNK